MLVDNSISNYDTDTLPYKISSHKTDNFKSVFLLLCLSVYFSVLSKTQHLCIIWKIEAVFQLFLSLHI